MTEGIISVVLPVWKPDFSELKLCMDSVVGQTYKDLEIIIIYRKSDGFDENFYSLISEYKDNRIRIIEGKKTGFTNSLNEGIESSTGKFIARIDADDYCDTSRFEKQIEFKKKYNYDIVGSWAYSISHEGKVIGKIELPVTHDEIRKKMMLHCPMLHPAILMDRKVFSGIGMYDAEFIHAEDYELYFRAMSHNYKFGNVPEYLVYIREGKFSRSRGEEWKTQRRYYVKAKKKAREDYGFNKYYDVLYNVFTPFSYFVSPRMALQIKKLSGWYKNKE